MIGILVGASLRTRADLPAEKLSWLLYAGLAVVLSSFVWVEDWAFMRALSELYVLGALIVITTGGWRAKLVGAGTGGIWVLMFVVAGFRWL